MPLIPPSYLGGMTSQQRAEAAVMALKAHVPLIEVYAGGWQQFCALARPIYRDYGLTEPDLQRIWRLIERAAIRDLRRLRVH